MAHSTEGHQELLYFRMMVLTSVSLARQTDIHVFSDASDQAIAAVAYLRVVDTFVVLSVGFLMGKYKLAPLKGHTIPRLELCGAVLASEIGETVATHLNISLDRVHYYTDSKIVLGYIHTTRLEDFSITYVTELTRSIVFHVAVVVHTNRPKSSRCSYQMQWIQTYITG